MNLMACFLSHASQLNGHDGNPRNENSEFNEMSIEVKSNEAKLAVIAEIQRSLSAIEKATLEFKKAQREADLLLAREEDLFAQVQGTDYEIPASAALIAARSKQKEEVILAEELFNKNLTQERLFHQKNISSILKKASWNEKIDSYISLAVLFTSFGIFISVFLRTTRTHTA